MDFSKYFPLINKKNQQPVNDQPLVNAYNEQVDPDILDSSELLGLTQTPTIPFAPEVQQAPPVAQPVIEKAPAPTIEQTKRAIAGEPIQPAQKAAATLEAPAIPDYTSLLKSAQENQVDNMFVNNMLKAGQTIGSAISRSGQKPDYSVADGLNEQSGKDVENVLQQMKSKKDEIGLGDEKNLRDPKSDVSKAFRSTLAKLGIPYSENTTAWDAKALGINPQNLLMQDRALEKQMKMMEHKEGKEKDAFITGAQKMLQKPYQQYKKVATALESISKYSGNEASGPKDVAILYNFVRGLDPESAVREGEIGLAKNAMSLLEQAGLNAKKLTKGDLLSPTFRKAVVGIMQDNAAQAKAVYEEQAQPFKLQGASKGLSEDDYGRFDYMSAAEAKKAKEGQDKVLSQTPASTVQEGLVERKTKDGRTALFDPTTKAFVKYKD